MPVALSLYFWLTPHLWSSPPWSGLAGIHTAMPPAVLYSCFHERKRVSERPVCLLMLTGPYPDLCTREFLALDQRSSFFLPLAHPHCSFRRRSSVLPSTYYQATQGVEDWALASVLWNLIDGANGTSPCLPPFFPSLSMGQPPILMPDGLQPSTCPGGSQVVREVHSRMQSL